MSDEEMEDYGFEYSEEDEPEEDEQIETENTYYSAKGGALWGRQLRPPWRQRAAHYNETRTTDKNVIRYEGSRSTTLG